MHYWVQSEDDSVNPVLTNDYTVTVTISGLPAVTGLNAWYDAAVGVPTSGATVTGWDGQSGNGKHSTTGDGSPELAASQVNGLTPGKTYNYNLYIDSAWQDQWSGSTHDQNAKTIALTVPNGTAAAPSWAGRLTPGLKTRSRCRPWSVPWCSRGGNLRFRGPPSSSMRARA